MTRVRLDSLLAERGLFASRSRAAAAVMAGEVSVSDRRALKPGQLVDSGADIAVAARQAYVSRGGVKLANALSALHLTPSDRLAIDVGASTGGFTDCMLQLGAEHVAAVDVAYGELDYRLRKDPRVTVIERVNARALDASLLPYRPSFAAIDVSFISLTKVLPAVIACMDTSFDCVAMVKPQFEAGRGHVGKGGVVRDVALRRSAVESVAACGASLGCAVMGFAPSGLPGPAGNLETFVWLAEGGRDGALADIAAALAGVDL